MADSSLTLVFDQTDPLNIGSRDRIDTVLPYLQKQINGFVGGNKRFNRLQVWADGAAPRYARAVVVMSGGSGAVGATVNGVSLTTTWATSDTASSTAFAAVVNASSNALVQFLVQACNFSGTATLASVAAGDYIEFNVTGLGTFRFTAKNGGTLDASEFDMSGNDTADATSLTTQINNRAGLNQYVFADSSAGVVTIRQIAGTTAALTMSKSASTITLVALAAGTSTLISSLVPGVVGNCQTIAASGTGVSIAGAATRLANGAGNNVSAINIYP